VVESLHRIRQQPAGLRARKKEQTRKRVVEAAASMFAQHGYENVRMIDIAQAVDISEQTLYNYFPSKEHLVFDRDKDLEARIVNLVLNRDRTASLAETLRIGAFAFLEEISESVGRKTGIPPSVAAGPELRRVWVEMNARWADALTDALSKDTKIHLSRGTAKFVARSIIALFAAVMEGVGEGVIAGKSRRAIVKDLKVTIRSATLLIDRGFES
jgi:AcrR family transcriptional regulator